MAELLIVILHIFLYFSTFGHAESRTVQTLSDTMNPDIMPRKDFYDEMKALSDSILMVQANMTALKTFKDKHFEVKLHSDCPMELGCRYSIIKGTLSRKE